MPVAINKTIGSQTSSSLFLDGVNSGGGKVGAPLFVDNAKQFSFPCVQSSFQSISSFASPTSQHMTAAWPDPHEITARGSALAAMLATRTEKLVTAQVAFSASDPSLPPLELMTSNANNSSFYNIQGVHGRLSGGAPDVPTGFEPEPLGLCLILNLVRKAILRKLDTGLTSAYEVVIGWDPGILPRAEINFSQCPLKIEVNPQFIMAENFYRPIPQRSSFRPFSELLSETNEEANEEFQCLNDDIISQQSPESVPCTLFDSEMQSVNIMHSDFPENQSTRVPQASTNLAKGQGSSSQQRVNRARWSVAETLILIDAKRREKDLYNTSGVMRKTKSSSEKWQDISIYCQANALERTATQCKDRWEHIQPDYKKINDYERNIPSGHDIEDTSATDFGAFEDQLDPASHGIGIPKESNDISDDISVEGNKQSTGKKRKSISKMSGVKATLIESNKMIIHSLDMAEEARTKCHESTEAAQMERHKQRMEMDNKVFSDHASEMVSALNNIGQALLLIGQSMGTFRPGIEFDQLHTEDSVPKSHDGKTTGAAYEDVVINIMKVDRVIEIKVPHQKKGQCELVLVGA
eukprot:Gb_13787 [translate_table: standard]